MNELERIAKEEHPDMRFEALAYGEGNISQSEFRASMKYIKEHDLVSKAYKLIEESKGSVSGIMYPITLPGQELVLDFRLHCLRPESVYVADILSKNILNEDILEVSFFDMSF